MHKITFPPPVREATFLKRLNRFAALAETPDGSAVHTHVPNSGKLKQLLVPGNRVLLTGEKRPGRKTECDLTLVSLDNGSWVCIDSRLPSLILETCWGKAVQSIPFQGWEIAGREPGFGRGRFDLLLQKGTRKCLVETKSVTLVQGSTALFPDTPTERGRRHMEELLTAVQKGYRAAVFFITQREDAAAFTPNREADPLFEEALLRAFKGGVEVYAFLCKVKPEGIALKKPLPYKM